MKNISRIEQAEKLLSGYIADMHRLSGKDVTLARMLPLMNILGNPERRLKLIHVAGTSGKTSTSYYIADLLHRSGRKVGLTVSPHIDTITERIQLNGKPIADDVFCQALGELLTEIEGLEFRPTYFELLIALAYRFFARAGVDYAVIETGLGGLHDATNVASGREKVCVITDIGFDHMHILGHDIASIAAQKAGIIHAGNQVFMHRQNDTIRSIVAKRITTVNHGAKVHYAKAMEIGDLPAFQARNWSLAKAVYDYIAERDGLDRIGDKQLLAGRNILIPGRINRLKASGREIVIDGAHNSQKMAALVESLRQLCPNQKFAAIVGFKSGKDYRAALTPLRPIVSNLVVTSFQTGQDTYITSADPTEVAEFARELGYPDVHIEPKLSSAIEYVMRQQPVSPVLITGSLYLVGQARAHLLFT